MNREELIQKALAFGYEDDETFALADFCLPLLAAERERAIEECARIADPETHEIDPKLQPRRDEAARIAHRIRALRRAPEKLEPGADNARGIVTAAYPVAQQCDVKPEGAGSTPAPERLPDWAEAIAMEYLDGGVNDPGLAALLRSRFQPLVEALVRIHNDGASAYDAQIAKDALAHLRAGAKGGRK